MLYEWEKDPYAKEWKDRLDVNSLKPYRSTFNQWMNFIQMSPTEQIKKRIQDLQNDNPKIRGYFEDKVKEYMNMLVTQGYKENSVRNAITSIRSFFAHHRVKLTFGRTELRFRSAPTEKIIDKFVPLNEEIKTIIEIAKIRDKALILTAYQSGFTSVDTLSLNVENINNLYDLEDHYFIQMHREKSDSVTATCISKEAINSIQLMLKSRGNPTKGALFVSPKGKRLNQRFFNDTIKKYAFKVLPKERAEQFIAKSLRDAYNCALLEANITQETKDLLFGHQRTGAKSSYAYNENVIRNAYEKVFKFLSINGETESKKQLQKIEQTVSTLNEMMSSQTQKIENLENENKNLKTELEATEERINETISKRVGLAMQNIVELLRKQNLDVSFENHGENCTCPECEKEREN